jgi:hypothetical protein
MRHAPVVQTVMAICAALVAAGCTPSESLTDADPARPGIDTDAASVDGLIVGPPPDGLGRARTCAQGLLQGRR